MEGGKPITDMRFGRFRAVREIGRGATSRVYLAEEEGAALHTDAFGADDADHHGVKARRVAVKVVDFTDDRSKLSRRFRKLFATEAAVTAQFDHPNIAKVFDWKVEDKRAYLVMELIEGTGLDQFVTMDKLLPMYRVVGIVFKVAMALDYAHRRGIVHRDIKPANVMLVGDDEVKLMDFGLALNIRKNVNVDSTFINGLGSPSYMSPEQIKGYTLNHQTDLYSLGVMFYQMLTGRLPFRAPNTAALVYKIINTEAVAVTQLNPDLPDVTNKVIVRALEKDLYSRYRLGADMAKDLSAVRFQILQDNQVVPDETRWRAVRRLPKFAKLDDVDIWELLRLSAWRVLPPATVIMKDGEAGKSFGFIIEGEVEVEKGDRALAKLGRGDIIGEVGFLDSEGGTRDASITTLSQVTYLEINPSAFAFATEELVTEIRRIAVDTLLERMRVANRLAKRFSPIAVHPTAVPEGEVEVAAPAAILPQEAPGWSVFAKPSRAAAMAAALAPPVAEEPIALQPAPLPAPVSPPAHGQKPAPARAPAHVPPPVAAPQFATAPAARAPAAPTGRSSTVVVQPMPAATAAVIAQMALTQHPRADKAAVGRPFELGPDAGGGMVPATPVSDLPADAILTTELGANFDSASDAATTELAGGFVAPGGHEATSELPRATAFPSVATTEMAADFSQLPAIETVDLVAPGFDVHAPTGKGALLGARTFAATTEMAPRFDDEPPAFPPPAAGGRTGRSSSLMPPPREGAGEQSTQELASHMMRNDFGPDATLELSGGFALSDDDPLAGFGRDLFPPIGGGQGGRAGAASLDGDGGYEATQAIDSSSFSVPFPSLDMEPDEPVSPADPASGAEAEPYEATQMFDAGAYSTPMAAPDFEQASSADEEPYEATQMFDAGAFSTPMAAPDVAHDLTIEISGGFSSDRKAPDTHASDFFPPLKY